VSTGSNESAADTGSPDSASDAFRDLIEERYIEWEREFGEDVHLRRTISPEFKPKQ
jgi:hypothetical protein